MSIKLIPALLLVAYSGAASASGFQLLEQNASGIGNAYAGSAAVAENASTIYFNPAGMTQLQAREISIGISAADPSFKFHNNGSKVGTTLGATGEGGNAGGWTFIPNGYASWALNKDLYIGVGIGAPFGMKTEYDGRWLGAAQSIKFKIQTLNINPSIAYRVSDTVSLGAGLSWQQMKADYTRLASTYNFGGFGNYSAVTAKLKLDDSAWGWNIGGLFALSPSTNIGLSYRSRIKYNAEGDIKLSSDGSVNGDVALNALLLGNRQSSAKASLTVPDTFIMSMTHKLSDKWEMLGDVSRTGWSSIPKVDIMRTSGSHNGEIAQTLNTNFRNTWRVALGANYKINSALKLKYGVAYDQTPVKGAQTRTVSLPDNDRVWLSLGAQWMPNKASRLDLGAAYIVVRNSKIDNDQSTTFDGQGHITGDYKGNIWLLGAQYSISF